MISRTAKTGSPSFRFWMLIGVVIVAGLSQGLLLPLLTILLEQRGVAPDQNGLNAAALYIGIFATMFFVEKPVRRYGYKPVITVGIIVVTIAVMLFPLWDHLIFWFVLRLIVGIGDSALHYATQLWIVSGSSPERRGRNISIYGMAYGTGFSLGPFGINLLGLGIWAPFVIVSMFFVIILLLFQQVGNEVPEKEEKREQTSAGRYSKALRIAWFALLPSFIYGYMESSLNSNFPIYGLRTGLTDTAISVLLPVLGFGGLLLQLPLGIWSDRIGRKPVLMIAGLTGAFAFLLVPFAGTHVWLIGVLFLVAGGMVGSFFSMGLAYAADILPRPLLPAANVIATIHYSIGSIIGPGIGGICLRYLPLSSMFVFLGGVYMLFALSGIRFNRVSNDRTYNAP